MSYNSNYYNYWFCACFFNDIINTPSDFLTHWKFVWKHNNVKSYNRLKKNHTKVHERLMCDAMLL